MTQPPLAFPTEDKRRSSKPFKVLLGAFTAGAITVVLAIQVVVPWLGRRGNLNRFFEDTISSTLNFPVVIESIDTQPLSELTLTRLTAVNAVEAGKVRFSADEVSFYYEPVDLVQGRIARAVLSGPEMFLNLDADLSGVAKLPDVAQKKPSVSRVESFLPFTVEETAIRSGKVTLQLLGRQINLGSVRLTFRNLGKRSGQSFRVELEALGATFTAEGRLDLELDGDVTRYVFRHAEINVRDLAIESVWQWLGPSLGIDQPSGIVALEGHLEGVWPDEVRIKLRSKTTNGNANYGSNLQLSEFQSELGINMLLRDTARTVEFDVQADASAILHRPAGVTNETLQFAARGRYDTPGQSLPRLQIETLQVNSSQMGRVHLAGVVSSREKGRDPSIDLSAQVEDVEPARLVGLLQEKQPSGGADQFALQIKAHLNGTFNEMVADGNVEIVSRARSNPIPVATGEFRGLVIRPRGKGAELSLLELEVNAKTGDRRDLLFAQFITKLAALTMNSTGKTGKLGWLDEIALEEGRSELSFTVSNAYWGSTRHNATISVGVDVAGASISSSNFGVIGENVTLAASLETHFSGTDDPQPLDASLSVGFGELLIDDSVLGPSKPTTLTVSGSWIPSDSLVPKSLDLTSLTLHGPVAGTTKGQATLSRSKDGLLTATLDSRTTNISVESLFDFFIRQRWAESFTWLSNSTVGGKAELDILLRGPIKAPALRGRMKIAVDRAQLGRITLDRVEIDAPFTSGNTTSPANNSLTGSIRAATIKTPAWSVRNFRLPYELHDQTYSSTSATTIDLFDGRIDLRSLQFSPSSTGGPALRLEATASDLNLATMTKAYNWPQSEGRINASILPAVYQAGRIEWNGSLTANVFGGSVVFRDLLVEDLFYPYASFEMRSGTIGNLSLYDLCQTFNYGVISGVLQGKISDVSIVGNQLATFDVDVETVYRNGVEQFIDYQAVQNLSRTLGNSPGKTSSPLFSKFHYDRFGFHATLDDEAIRIRGKYVEDDVEHIMLGRWYQIPRVSIITANPGREYDWKHIVDTMHEVYVREDD